MNEVVTRLVKIDKNNIDKLSMENAANIIRNGGLVAFPTETVYGLGANALDTQSTKKIYTAKQRPSDNPLIVHIADLEEVYKLVKVFPKRAELLARKFWAGPLTMILYKSDIVPFSTTGGLDSVAIRMPENEIARSFIRACKLPIAAPSANTSGRPSPTNALHVYEDMNKKIEMILDGGDVKIGLESTIIDMTRDIPVILRPGAITKEMLENVIGEVIYNETSINLKDEDIPKAPGMKYRHYAPKAKLIVIEGEKQKVLDKFCELIRENLNENRKVGLIVTSENYNILKSKFENAIDSKKLMLENIADSENEEMIAHNLFNSLRAFDEKNVDIIYSESFYGKGLRVAIMNRLMKAAGHQKISL